MTNTPNPANDSTKPVTDYNSMQPQSNPLGVLPTDNSSGSAQVDPALNTTVQPSSMETSSIDALSQNPEDINTNQGVESTEPELQQPQQETPVMAQDMPIPDTQAFGSESNTAPQVEDTSNQVIENAPVAPELTPTPEIVAEETPAPVMESTLPESDTSMQTDPVDTVKPAVESESSDVFASAAPTENADTQPAFPVQESSSPDMSSSLSEPLGSIAQDTTPPVVEDVVNTLEEGRGEEKGNSVVIVVLVIIIVLLLAGIGYFGYQIFFS